MPLNLKAVKINKKTIILLLFLFAGVNSLHAHPFYVSICQVKYNTQTNALEIALKTFVDDLILGLEHSGKSKLYIGEAKEDPNTDRYIFEYIQKNMDFTINSKKKDFSFVGRELEDDVVWTYLQISNVDQLNRIEVESTLLTEVLEDQSNIIQVNVADEVKNLLLNIRDTSGALEF